MQILKKLWRLLNPIEPPRNRELRAVNYVEGDRLLRAGEGWRLAPEEDYNNQPNLVYLERDV